MRLKSDRHARGFTLIEIIVTLTITAVLATMIFTYFGKAFTESVKPIIRLKSSATLQRAMENITADYNVYPKWRSGTAYTNIHYVIPTNFNGFYYQCTVAGTSGTSEPTNWPLSPTLPSWTRPRPITPRPATCTRRSWKWKSAVRCGMKCYLRRALRRRRRAAPARPSGRWKRT